MISDSNLAFELEQWATSNSNPVTALSSLLGMLRVFHPSLPKDPRTLLKTPCPSNLKLVEGGAYFHFGIANCLSKSKELLDFVSQNSDDMADPLPALSLSLSLSLSLQVNFDGLPLFKSWSTQFWPILGRWCLLSFWHCELSFKVKGTARLCVPEQ